MMVDLLTFSSGMERLGYVSHIYVLQHSVEREIWKVFGTAVIYHESLTGVQDLEMSLFTILKRVCLRHVHDSVYVDKYMVRQV